MRAAHAAIQTDAPHGISHGLPLLHILGHPDLPLDLQRHPENAQLFTTWNFCQLAEHLGCAYFLYALEGTRLPAGTHGVFVSLGQKPAKAPAWAYGNRWHREYTRRLETALPQKMHLDGRFELCASLYGIAHQDVKAARQVPVLEPMAGYQASWSAFRVFPSYAHQTATYSRQEAPPHQRFFDAVIPHFLRPQDYPLARQKEGNFLLYLGRNTPDKGVELAREIAEKAKVPIRCIHSGCHGKEKLALLQNAKALLAPTLYQEPFGYAVLEAMFCGTPVITTDWGAFPELVAQEKTGFRCRTTDDFLYAVQKAPSLSPHDIRSFAIQRYSLAKIAPLYRSYFHFVQQVWTHGGFYAPHHCHSRFFSWT